MNYPAASGGVVHWIESLFDIQMVWLYHQNKYPQCLLSQKWKFVASFNERVRLNDERVGLVFGYGGYGSICVVHKCYFILIYTTRVKFFMLSLSDFSTHII